jgi:hypothetical protein
VSAFAYELLLRIVGSLLVGAAGLMIGLVAGRWWWRERGGADRDDEKEEG